MKPIGAKNITYTQRLQIETLLNAKKKVKEISTIVGLHRTTIYKEIKKGLYKHKSKVDTFWYGVKEKFTNKYSAQISQERYNFLCTSKGRPLKIGNDFDMIHYIENKVNKEKLSACAVLGYIKKHKLPFTDISKTTLYRYIELGLFDNIKLDKRKKTYKKTYIKRVSKGTSIEKRPIEIKQRKTFGHWEMDCVCGSSKATLLVLSERLSRKEIIFKMENQKAESVIKCLNILERKYGKLFKKVFKSITMDNGSEFSDFNGIEKSSFGGRCKRTITFYCHPYCSSERGTNERLNREIRRLIPKGSNLAHYSAEDIQKVENWVNNYPRQILDFSSSDEVFNQHLLSIA